MPSLRTAEVQFFRMLNRVVEPRVRAGFGSPCLTPGGFIVLETKGRKTGRRARTPLAATRIQGHVVVGTFRGQRSQWVKNLVAHPDIRFWIGGRPKQARAFVIDRGRRDPAAPAELPSPLRWVISFLRPYTAAGWVFAVLAPVRPTSSAVRKPAAARLRAANA